MITKLLIADLGEIYKVVNNKKYTQTSDLMGYFRIHNTSVELCDAWNNLTTKAYTLNDQDLFGLISYLKLQMDYSEEFIRIALPQTNMSIVVTWYGRFKADVKYYEMTFYTKTRDHNGHSTLIFSIMSYDIEEFISIISKTKEVSGMINAVKEHFPDYEFSGDDGYDYTDHFKFKFEMLKSVSEDIVRELGGNSQ